MTLGTSCWEGSRISPVLVPLPLDDLDVVVSLIGLPGSLTRRNGTLSNEDRRWRPEHDSSLV